MPNLSTSFKTLISSSRRKSVFLRDWWLIKTEGDCKLGVGGFFTRETLETRGMRLFGSPSIDKRHERTMLQTGIQVFVSAAIAKRHDNNTLESVDGIIITVIGSLNRSRTQHNGFSPEICNYFLSGFPWNWEEYAAKPSLKKHAETPGRPLPVSFVDLPIIHVRDLLMSATSESETRALTSVIFNDILKQCGVNSLHQDEDDVGNSVKTYVEHKQEDGSLQKTTEEVQTVYLSEDVPKNPKETEVKTDNDDFLPNITEESQTKTPLRPNTNLDSHGSSRTAAKLSDPFSNPPVSKHPSERTTPRSNALKERNTTILSKKKRQAMKSQEESSVRRSARLKKKS